MMNFYLRNVENIECISRGSPGNRTFYLSVTNLNKVSGETDSTSKLKIWLEKEQLVALCLLLKTPEESQGNIEDNLKENSGEFNLEVRGTDFSINSDSKSYELIFLSEEENNELLSITINIYLDILQGKNLGDQILKVCESGRKKCPLCHLPKNLDGTCDGNPCVKKNGHINLN